MAMCVKSAAPSHVPASTILKLLIVVPHAGMATFLGALRRVTTVMAREGQHRCSPPVRWRALARSPDAAVATSCD